MAGRIPQSFINDLLGRVDIVGIINDRVPLKKAGKDYKANCPFHDEKTPSFNVSQDKQVYHCFGCDAGGTALTFLMEYDRLPFFEAVETLAALAGVAIPESHSSKPERDNSRLYEILQKAERYFRQQLKNAPEAVAYLESRGLTGVVARDFGIGFAPDSWDSLQIALGSNAGTDQMLMDAGLVSRNDRGGFYDRFRGRIQFPIRDTRGRVIGFGGRLLGGGNGPKYLNSPETPVFHKGEELYGLFEARKTTRRLNRFIVVEGYMDVIALAQSGVTCAVATLGTASGEDHYRKLFRYVDEVVCCFDGDQAGRRAAWRALENALAVLTEGRRLKFMFLPDGEDPDSLVRKRGAEDFADRLDQATPAIEYLFDELESGFDLGTVDDRARLASLAAPYVDKVPKGSLKTLMLETVRERTGVEMDQIASAATTGLPQPVNRNRKGSSRLADDLLARLLRRPNLLEAVSAEQIEAIVNRHQTSLFQDVVKYLAVHPDADSARILGRWSGDRCHDELVRLFAQQRMLPDETEETTEFADDLARLIAAEYRHDRRQLIDEIRLNPSQDKLARFWSMKQGKKAETNP